MSKKSSTKISKYLSSFILFKSHWGENNAGKKNRLESANKEKLNNAVASVEKVTASMTFLRER